MSSGIRKLIFQDLTPSSMTPSSTRVVLSLFAGKERLTSSEIASALGLSTRMVRVLLKKWVEDGWLIVADQSNRGRAYVLSAIYRQSDDGIGEKQRGKFQRIIRRDHGDAKITR